MGATLVYKQKLSLYECQLYFEHASRIKADPCNKNVFMKPDGGVIFANKNGELIPILVVEDKVQGTNDVLFSQGKARQATGNAIERGAKNIRGAEMLFAKNVCFPYVLFASGCDFHHTETIAKRIEMMNMGVPNHAVYLSPNTTSAEIDMQLSVEIIPNINIKKINGLGIASVFVNV
jgi:hypothetical protein